MSMFSEVIVMPTRALATRDFQALLSPRALACGQTSERRVVKRLRGTKIDLRYREIRKRLPAPLASVRGSFEWQAKEVSASPTFHVPFDYEMGLTEGTLAFVSGPAEVLLFTVGGPYGVPLATEQQALRPLYSRAKAGKL
jgi:hypothetical protein